MIFITASFRTCTGGRAAEEIDHQVMELVRKQHEKAVQNLPENRIKMDQLAQYLYEYGTITGEEFIRILNAGRLREYIEVFI